MLGLKGGLLLKKVLQRRLVEVASGYGQLAQAPRRSVRLGLEEFHHLCERDMSLSEHELTEQHMRLRAFFV